MKRYTRNLVVLALVLLLLSACSGPEEVALDIAPPNDLFSSVDLAADCSVTISIGNELFMRRLNVVNDAVRTRWTGSMTNPADGAWHFGRLMANMAGTVDPSVFVRNWLSRWENDLTVNGFRVPARRSSIRQLIIDPWPKLPNGRLDLTKAPFRLLAIVNRMDLRDLARGNAGEGRFIFGAVGPRGEALEFTVILEYDLLATTESDVLKWANDWHSLGALSGSAYNDALQRLTDRFAGKNVAPGRRNGSALAQLRTNEIALNSPWDMREFVIGSSSTNNGGQLVPRRLALTPDRGFNATARLARFVNSRTRQILAGTHTVPNFFETNPDGSPARFAAGAILYERTDFWRGGGNTSINNNTARHLFSVNTCNGCHGRETNASFLHVFPRGPNEISRLSTFMTGGTVNDPVTGESRRFADLERRSTDLKNLLCAPAAALNQSSSIRTH